MRKFTYAGIWEQTGFRQIHMAKTGLLSQVFLFWSLLAVKGLQQSCHFEHTWSGKLCFSLGGALERWSLGAIETMLQGLGALFRCQGLIFFFFEHVDSSAITHPFLLSAVDASPCSTMTRVELDLHVKTIVLLTSRGARRRNVH